jgi:16S rRNA (uracil1498-N3)-methyltransferase
MDNAGGPEMRRLFAGQDDFHQDKIWVTDKENIKYLSVVLRMNAGDEIYISDGSSRVCKARISEISKIRIGFDIIEELPFPDGAGTRITLFQGMPKGAKMDEIVRKSTELGVYRIVPVMAARSVPDAKNGISKTKLERWRRIAEEAARQSNRFSIPSVSDIISFQDAASGLKTAGLKTGNYDLILTLYELEDKQTLKNALRKKELKSPEIAVFIGPEGGFEEEEVETLVKAGAETVTIGETILRTETAGPAAIAMIIYETEL